MMINKRNTKIVNDKKLLHKVGKQWVTVSIAMLSMLGAGVAVHSAKAANVSPSGEKPQTNVKAAQTSQPKNIKAVRPNNKRESNVSRLSYTGFSNQRVSDSQNKTINPVHWSKPKTIVTKKGTISRVVPFTLDLTNASSNNGHPALKLGTSNQFNPIYSQAAEQSPQPPMNQSRHRFSVSGATKPISTLPTTINGQTMSQDQFNQTYADLIKDYLLQNINSIRAKYGLKPVSIDTKLQQVADLRAKQGYEAYVVQPSKFTHEQMEGNNSDSDNLIHGKDWNETFIDDEKKLGVRTPITPIAEFFRKQINSKRASYYALNSESSNAGCFSASKGEGHDVWPVRFFVNDTTTPQGVANTDSNSMVYDDRFTGNGHASAILNPLYDEVGLGVYFFNAPADQNTSIQSDLQSHHATVEPYRTLIHGAVEEDFTSSEKLAGALHHYMFTHMYRYTSKSGLPTKGCYLYQTSNIHWTKNTQSGLKDLLGTNIPVSGSKNIGGETFPIAPVVSSPSNGRQMGYLTEPGFMMGWYNLNPTGKSATDNHGDLYGQFQISSDKNDNSQAWLGYLPLGRHQQVVVPDPEGPVNNNGVIDSGGDDSDNTPDSSSNTPSGSANDSNQPSSANSANNNIPQSGSSTSANSTSHANNTGSGPNNNNNSGAGTNGKNTSNNNNPSNNVVTPDHTMINNNDHDYYGGNTNSGSDNNDNDDKALIIAASMMNNNDPHYADVLASLKDNDMNSALARNQYAAVSEMARNMSASNAAESESAAIVNEQEQDEGANDAAYLKSSAAVQSLADSLANAANWQSEAQSIIMSAQAASTSHRGQLASANAAIDAAAQNALNALNNDSDLPENLKASYADQIEADKGSALTNAIQGNNLAGLSAAVNGESQQIQAAANTMNSEDFADGLHSAQSSLDSDVNSGLNSLDANPNLTSNQKSLAASTLNSAANVTRKQFSLPTTDVSELGSLVNGMTSQTASVLSSAASQANSDMMSAESQADSTINSEQAAAVNSINAAPNLTANQKSAEISQVNSEANTEKSAVPAGGTSYANAVIESGDEPAAHASALPPFPVLQSGTAPRMSSTSTSVNPSSSAMGSQYPKPLAPSQKANSYRSIISGLPNPLAGHKVPDHVTSAHSYKVNPISSAASQQSSSKPDSMASSASNSSTASSSSMNSLQSAIASIESSEGIKPASNTSASGSYASSATGTSTSSSVSSSAISPASLTSSVVSERASARSALAAQEALLKSQNRISGNDGYYDGKGLWHWNTAGGKRQPGVNGYYDKLGNWTPVNLSKLEAEANAGDDTSNGGYYDKFGFWHPGSSTSARGRQAVKPSSPAEQKFASASLSPKQRAIDSRVNTMTGHKADQKRQSKPTTKRSRWQWADNDQPLHVSGHFRSHKSAPKADVPAEDVEPATNEFLPDGTVDGLKAMNGSGDPEGIAQVPNGVNDAEAGSDQSTNGQAQNGELPQTSESVNDTGFAFGFLMLAFGLAALDLGKKKKQRA